MVSNVKAESRGEPPAHLDTANLEQEVQFPAPYFLLLDWSQTWPRIQESGPWKVPIILWMAQSPGRPMRRLFSFLIHPLCHTEESLCLSKD